MTNKRHLAVPDALMLAMLFVSFAVPSCATFRSIEDKIAHNLPAITSDLGDVRSVVGSAETWLDAYFARHPNPDAQGQVAADVIRVNDAIDGVQAIARAVGDLDGASAQAALSELWNAYQAFAALARTFGAKVGAMPPGERRVGQGGSGAPVALPRAQDFRIMDSLKVRPAQ